MDKFGILLLLLLSLSGPQNVYSNNVIKWTGCSISKKAFMKEVAEAYKKKYKIDVRLSGGGAAKGIRSAAKGTVDVGGSCRHRMQKKETEDNAQLIQVAWDALVVIVNPKNKLKNITIKQLKDIYDGKTLYWNKLSKDVNAKINLVTRRGKESGVGHMFRLMVFDKPNYDYMAPSIIVKSSSPLEKRVENDQYALAADGISSAKKRNVKILSIDGVSPTKENIQTGKYPLFRPLYLAINRKNPSVDGKKLIEYVLSPEGQKIISNQGTVNLEEGEMLKKLWNEKLKKWHRRPE